MKLLLILIATVPAGHVLAFPQPAWEAGSKRRLIDRSGHGTASGGPYDREDRHFVYSDVEDGYEGDGSTDPGFSDEDEEDRDNRDGRDDSQSPRVYSDVDIADLLDDDPYWEVMEPVPGPQHNALPPGVGGYQFEDENGRLVIHYPQYSAELPRARQDYREGFEDEYPGFRRQYFEQYGEDPEIARRRIRATAQSIIDGTLSRLRSRYENPPLEQYRVMRSRTTPEDAASFGVFAQSPPPRELQRGVIYQSNPPAGPPPPLNRPPVWNARPEERPVYQRLPHGYHQVPSVYQPPQEGSFSDQNNRFADENEVYSNPYWRNSRRKRRSVVTSILEQEDGAVPHTTNITAAQIAQFQKYLGAYQTIQTNISDALFPLFDFILNGTNSQIIYEMLWSIYSDLTCLGPKIIGPFSYGQHSFDWIEDRYFGNKTNVTAMTITNTTDPTTVSFLATNSLLIDLYGFAWSNAIKVTNQTGLLADMTTLGRYMVSARNLSIAPPEWTAPQKDFDDSYFTNRNRTVGNFTA